MLDTLAMILAGGVGSRLNVLVRDRAKPAVPFGGIYRIIDFALSNAMNSGLEQAAVLTQYKPLSLMRHIGTGASWDFIGRTRGVEILPPRTGEKDSDWYKGTADAVRQNIDFIETRPSKYLLILSGDHVYHMDYKAMLKAHADSNAAVTVAMLPVPWEDASQFGIGIVDGSGMIVDWEEKPEKPGSNLASMGIYIFNTDYLLDSLRGTKDTDFGHHVLPMAMKHKKLFAYKFSGYWRDVGTLHAYWDANMDLLRQKSSLEPESWGICTNMEGDIPYERPPAWTFPGDDVKSSAVAPGCYIKGKVFNSILSPGVVVEKGAEVYDSILMHDAWIGENTKIHRLIADKKVKIGENCLIGKGDYSVPNREHPKHLYTGLTLMGKASVCPARRTIGTNCIIYPYSGEKAWSGIHHLPDGETLFA